MAASRTMRVAQDLYEGIDIGEGGGPVGLITYMRTDSVNVAKEAQAEARALIAEQFGPEYVPAEPNVFKSRAKNAQEAHEAIRPTSVNRSPAALRDKLSAEQFRLYELIWRRFVASQMAAAIYDTLTVDVEAGQARRSPAPVSVPGQRLDRALPRLPGRLQRRRVGSAGERRSREGRRGGKSAGAGTDRATARTGTAETASGDGQSDGRDATRPSSRTSRQPDRGRAARPAAADSPSSTSRSRPRATRRRRWSRRWRSTASAGRARTPRSSRRSSSARYVERSEKKLIPTDLGFTVNDLLVKYFDTVFNVGFTAQMEEHLDSISRGETEMAPVLREFYDFFEPQLQNAERTMEKVSLEPEKTGEICPEDGGELVIKQGRYGRFVGCSNYPTCRFTKPLVAKIGVLCPKDRGEIVERRTRQGRIFYGCSNYPTCDWTSWKRPLPQPCPQCESADGVSRQGHRRVHRLRRAGVKDVALSCRLRAAAVRWQLVQEQLDAYVKHLVAERNASPHTVSNYRREILQFTTFAEGHGHHRVAGGDAGAAAPVAGRAPQARGYVKASVARRISELRSFYTFMRVRGAVEANPVQGDLVAASCRSDCRGR